MYQKWPDQIFPIVNFVFSHYGHFGLGRGGGGFGGGVPPPSWFLIILKKPWGGGGAWMDGWRKLAGGCSLGHRSWGFDCVWSLPAKPLEFGVPASVADPRDLGSDEMERVTHQLLVGNFGSPGPPWTAVERQGNLKHPGAPGVRAGTIKGDEEREGGRDRPLLSDTGGGGGVKLAARDFG